EEEAEENPEKKQKTQSMEEDPEAKYEQEKKDVEEFNERLKEKDVQKTKKSNQPNKFVPKEEEEAIVRRSNLKATSNASLVEQNRTVSRRMYLKKREPQKLEELKIEIAEEEAIFGKENLTEQERR